MKSEEFSMEKKIMKKTIKLDGLTCTSCETKIENKLNKTEGVLEAKVSYVTSILKISYDENVISLEEIFLTIEKLDYKVIKEIIETDNSKREKELGSLSKNTSSKSTDSGINDTLINKPYSQYAIMGIMILGIYLIVKNTVGFNYIPDIKQNMGYGILFVVGLLTSIHCVAMCGGINLSLCASYKYEKENTSKYAKLMPSLMYNAGRVVSYTVLGGIVGTLGSVFSLSNSGRAFIAIFAGAFMIIMGLNMLNIIPALRVINPHMPKVLVKKVNNSKKGKGPFVVGLLNGLMPCGPLQAMQIYALGTGSMIAGAISMFLFSLGTVPLLFLFGALGSLLSTKFTKNMMKASAILVIVLGLIMANRGLAFTGFTFDSLAADKNSNSNNGVDTSSLNNLAENTGDSSNANTAVTNGDVQELTTTLESGKYPQITVQKGVPVKWTIKADANNINGCNRQIIIPEYGIQQDLAEGDNVITFTPDKSGKFGYSCWMGMIRSSITVTDGSNTSGKTGDTTNNTDNSDNSSGTVDNSGLPAGCCGR